MALFSTGRLTIDLNAVRSNYRTLKKRVGDACIVSAVVKADGYGLGAGAISEALLSEGCTHFFVASPMEGCNLRPHVKNAKIYVLNGFYDRHSAEYSKYALIPVLDNLEEIEHYKAFAKAKNQALAAVLNFNTGMNRLGFGANGTKQLLEHPDILNGLKIDLIMSHLACADEPDHILNDQQYQIFQMIASHFPDVKKSLANSFGIFCNKAYHFDMVRPGMALYGLNPTPRSENPMKSVASLKVPIIRLRKINAGESIGYNATYTFSEDTLVATVAAGYADGLFRSLSNQGTLYWGKYPCIINGRVSMDLISVNLSNVPEKELPKPGDFLEILGPYQTADNLAHTLGTIGYEILTSLGGRYKRQYINS